MGIINIVESLEFLCPGNQFLGLRCLSKEFLGLTCLNKHRSSLMWFNLNTPGTRVEVYKTNFFFMNQYRVECHYNAVQYTMIYVKQHCNERGRIQTKHWSHKRRPVSCPHGWAMECLTASYSMYSKQIWDFTRYWYRHQNKFPGIVYLGAKQGLSRQLSWTTRNQQEVLPPVCHNWIAVNITIHFLYWSCAVMLPIAVGRT